MKKNKRSFTITFKGHASSGLKVKDISELIEIGLEAKQREGISLVSQMHDQQCERSKINEIQNYFNFLGALKYQVRRYRAKVHG